MSIDLSVYSVQQLEELATQIQDEIKRKKAAVKKNLIADLERIVVVNSSRTLR